MYHYYKQNYLAPNVIAPLIGQKKPNHVKENIELAKVAPLTTAEFSDAIKIFD